ncbi:MAG: tetratricopeptide repeat protein [Bryobacteraceae bacterium]
MQGAQSQDRLSAEARINLGQFHFTQGKLAEAEAEIRQAAELDPGTFLPRVLWARFLVRAGKLAEAEKLYQGIKTIAPNDPQAYQALGHFYVSTGQKEKAVAEGQKRRSGSCETAAIGPTLPVKTSPRTRRNSFIFSKPSAPSPWFNTSRPAA